MRTLKYSKALTAAGLLAAAAAFATPAAFADNHHRGHDRGHVLHQHPPAHAHGPRNRGRVVHSRQPVFHRGRAIPVSYRHAIRPLPAAYRYRVPVVPRGYSVGYYQGYSVVYDPATFLIVSVIDLLVNS